MKNLYLPVTSQPRELESRLLLALHASEAGIRPFIGYKSVFRARRVPLPPGYFLAHNARQKPEKLGRLARFGHSVLVLDEEALVRQSDDIFLGKHEKDAFEFAHHVLCWGQDDADMWARSDFDLGCGTSIVGNPRMDLLRPEMAAYYAPAVERLHATYGAYVLLNTNFPTVNNFVEGEGGVAMANWALDGEGERERQAFLANKRKLYEATLALVRPLAEAIAPLALVVRPHPNEDHTPWHEAVAGIDNAHAVFEGGVNPWIFGATAMVHNSCTTAIEAAVAGVPVLNFRPWQSAHDNAFAHAVGMDCKDAAAIAGALKAIQSGGEGRSPEQTKLLRHHLVSVDGDFSCQRI
ncbi:MAG: surface carbohydrate biosynthesis protein, partial [Pseudomonadota bacterium]|nr:surface carbohydrate biosynthesis protein [Pseudomonadota bacterium]